jgi:hypothetical protein
MWKAYKRANWNVPGAVKKQQEPKPVKAPKPPIKELKKTSKKAVVSTVNDI